MHPLDSLVVDLVVLVRPNPTTSFLGLDVIDQTTEHAGHPKTGCRQPPRPNHPSTRATGYFKKVSPPSGNALLAQRSPRHLHPSTLWEVCSSRVATVTSPSWSHFTSVSHILRLLTILAQRTENTPFNQRSCQNGRQQQKSTKNFQLNPWHGRGWGSDPQGYHFAYSDPVNWPESSVEFEAPVSGIFETRAPGTLDSPSSLPRRQHGGLSLVY